MINQVSCSSLRIPKLRKNQSYLVSLFMLFKAYEAKAFGFSSGVCHHFNTQSFTCYQGTGLVKHHKTISRLLNFTTSHNSPSLLSLIRWATSASCPTFGTTATHTSTLRIPQSDSRRGNTDGNSTVKEHEFTASLKVFLYLPYLLKSSFSLSSSMSSPKFLI